MKDDLPQDWDNEHARARSQREHALNAEDMSGKRPRRLKQHVIIGVILGSFFFLVVGCWYWVGLDKPKIDRTNFEFGHQPKRP